MPVRWEMHEGIRWRISPGLTTSPGFDTWTAARVSRTARNNLQRGRIPDLIRETSVRYQRDPRGCDLPVPWWRAERTGVLDCKTAGGWLLAQLYQKRGRWPDAAIVPSGADRLIHVRLVERDPSQELIDLGRYARGRRPADDSCRFSTPFRAGQSEGAGTSSWTSWTTWGDPSCSCEGGARSADRRREDLLHWTLQELLQRGRAAGLPVSLTSGHRSWEDQVSLWEERIAAARADGDPDAPRSWDEAVANWERFGRWVLDEASGRHIDRGSSPAFSSWRRRPGHRRPALALPGTSPHNQLPAEGADIGAQVQTRAELEEVRDHLAEIGSDIVHRPVSGESWHFEPLPSLRNTPDPRR